MLRLARNNLATINEIVRRTISTTSVVKVKEINIETKDGIMEISAEFKSSPREALLLKEVTATNQTFCPKCTLGLDIKHTDVLILSQYISSDGSMLPRKITRLCNVQQRNINNMILMAKEAGLLPNFAPASNEEDAEKPRRRKEFNKYFNENTIKYGHRKINNFHTSYRFNTF